MQKEHMDVRKINKFLIIILFILCGGMKFGMSCIYVSAAEQQNGVQLICNKKTIELDVFDNDNDQAIISLTSGESIKKEALNITCSTGAAKYETESLDDGTVSIKFMANETGKSIYTIKTTKDGNDLSVQVIVYVDKYNEYSLGIYSVQDSGEKFLKITDYIGTEEIYTIPSEINGCKVKEIDNISNFSVKKIIVEEGIEVIGNYGFGGLRKLESIELPDSLKRIQYEAFAYDQTLKSITIPKGVEVMTCDVFQSANSLEEINVDSDNSYFESIDGVLYKKSSESAMRLFIYPEGKKDLIYRVPSEDSDGRKMVGFYNYYGGSIDINPNLKQLNIPKTVTHIDSWEIEITTLDKILYEGEKDDLIITGSTAARLIPLFEYNCKIDLTPTQSITIDKNSLILDTVENSSALIKATIVPSNGNIYWISEDPSVVKVTDGKVKAVDSGTTKVIAYNTDGTIYAECNVLVEDVVQDGFFFQILDDGTLQIKKYNGLERDVTIPDKIKFESGQEYMITSVGKNAFYFNYNIKSLVFPDTINNIESWAINSCEIESITLPRNKDFTVIPNNLFCGAKVKSITIPSNVRKISFRAFESDSQLEEVIIEEGVTEIEGDAFTNCDNLTTLNIPASVTALSMSGYCSKIKNINIDEKNTTYSSVDGVVYSKDKKNLIYCPVAKTFCMIPDGVENINRQTYSHIKNLVIPKSVKSIQWTSCTELRKIYYRGTENEWNNIEFGEYMADFLKIEREYGYTGDGTEIIGIDSISFEESEITIHTMDKVKHQLIPVIESADIADKSRIKWSSNNESVLTVDQDGTLNIKAEGRASITAESIDGDASASILVIVEGDKIDDYVCKLNEDGVSVTLLRYNRSNAISGDAVKDYLQIPEYLDSYVVSNLGCNFLGNANVKEIFIPKTIKEIDGNPFYNSFQLERINVADENNVYSQKDDSLYSKDGKILYVRPSGLTTVYEVPDGVERINDNAFYAGIAGVIIPQTLQEIGDKVFASSNIRIFYRGDEMDFNNITIGKDNYFYSIRYGFTGEYKKTTNLTIDITDLHMETIGDKSCVKLEVTQEGNPTIPGYTIQSGSWLVAKIDDDGNIIAQGTGETDIRIISNDKEKSTVCHVTVTETNIDGYIYVLNEDRKTVSLREYIGEEESISVPGSITVGDKDYNVTGIICFTFLTGNNNYTEENDVVKSITIPSSIEHINEDAFNHLKVLESINVAEGNKYYSSKDGVLYSADKTQVVRVPRNKAGSLELIEGVKKIVRYPYQMCTFEKIIIPESVIEIDVDALTYNLDLKEIIVHENNPSYSAENNILYNKSKSVLMLCPRNVEFDNILPSVDTIGMRAVYNNPIKSLYIPRTIKHFGYEAFASCYNLRDVYYEGSEEEWSEIDNYESFRGIYISPAMHYNYKGSAQSIQLAYDNLYLTYGETKDLEAVVIPSDAANTGITWRSSNSSVAVVEDGIVRAVSSGDAVISAVADDGINVDAKCEVHVQNSPTKIVPYLSVVALNKGSSRTLAHKIMPEDAVYWSMIKYESMDESIVKIDGYYIVGVAEGTAKVRMVLEYRPWIAAEFTVNVGSDAVDVINEEYTAIDNYGKEHDYKDNNEGTEQDNSIESDEQVISDNTGESETGTNSGNTGESGTGTNSGNIGESGTGTNSSNTGESGTGTNSGNTGESGTGTNPSDTDLIVPPAKDGGIIPATEQTIQAEVDVTSEATQIISTQVTNGSKVTVGDGSYQVTSTKEQTVTWVAPANDSTTSVTVPETVTVSGKKYKVTKIADNAFKNNKKIKKVKVSKNITEIGKNAFKGCKNLKTVNVGKNVKVIGNSAFEGCSSLTSVTIEKNVTKIGKKAYYNCRSLKKIYIKSEKLKSVGANAFNKINKNYKVKVIKKYMKNYQSLMRGKMGA